MADILDIARAGEVKQDALQGATEGAAQGLQLAAAYQKHQNDMQEFQNKQQQFKQQQSEWFAHKVASVAAIQDPALRAAQAKRVTALAQQAGVQVDPDIALILKNDDNAKAIADGYANAMHLPANARNSHMMDFMLSAGDAPGFLQGVNKIGEMNLQYVQNQQAMMKFQMEQTNERQKAFGEAQQRATTELKEPATQLTDANRIIDMANDPEMRKDPYQAATAQAALAKTLFPGGVIRESEMVFLNKINPGLGEKFKSWYKNTAGQGPLTEEMWKAYGQVAQHLADEASNTIQRHQTGAAPYLQSRGIRPEDVYSFIPPKSNYGGKPTKVAQNPPSGGAQAQARLAPEQQAAIGKVAAQMGMKLDASSPDYMQNLQALRDKILAQQKGGNQIDYNTPAMQQAAAQEQAQNAPYGTGGAQ